MMFRVDDPMHLVDSKNHPVTLDFSLGCNAEEHLTPCTVDVIAVAQTSCNNDVELWCSSAEVYYQLSKASDDLCYDCQKYIDECWIVNEVVSEVSYS